MIIPSYWARTSDFGWRAGDAVYDHPTPLDQDGTLFRALQSIQTLKDRDFELVVIAVPVAPDIAMQVEAKVAEFLAQARTLGVDARLFGPTHLSKIHQVLAEDGRGGDCDLLELQGYSNIRNLCLFAAHIFGSETAVLIDDDEVFEDADFMTKAREFVGGEHQGRAVSGVAGYYLQADGSYIVTKAHHAWMDHWDPHRQMNLAFEQTIGTEPRLKETNFVFGGNMVVDRSLFTKVPFDPLVTRGEDIDFLMNARMFGFDFFLDNQLSIKHLAPPKTHPVWRQMREDIHRFLYERTKLDSQVAVEGMSHLNPADLAPYPGTFLQGELETKMAAASRLLADEYLAEGDEVGARESAANARIALADVVKVDPFVHLCELQERWSAMMDYTGDPAVRQRLRDILA